MKSVLNHIAVLVPNALKSVKYLEKFNLAVSPANKYEGTGTLEVYVGDLNSQTANLLLMEPITEGTYLSAMKKRGPGLHHIAIDVLNIETYIDYLSGSGWLLHPKSLHTIKHSQTAYLARPGIPTLIEVQQCDVLSESPLFISNLMIPNLSPINIEIIRSFLRKNTT